MVWTWVPSEVSADPPGSSVILVTTAREEPALLPSRYEGYLWVCRSLRSVWMSTHSEEWVFRSPEFAVGRASIAPLTQRDTYEHAAPFWAAECLLILRNEFPALQSSWLGLPLALLVEPALLPSTRGSSMSLPLPSERLSSLSLRGMSSSPLQGIERSSNKCTRETLGTF